MSRAPHRLVRLGLFAAVAAVVLQQPRIARVRRRLIRRAGKRLRYLEGRLEGAEYKHLGQHPDPDVTDVLLADRVRSSLGPVEKRRDLPHVHVMAEGHTVLLHGEVPTEDDAEAIERAVLDVTGVAGVRSFLHIGLLPSDTRPSEGRSQPSPSDAYRRLVDAAAEAAGVNQDVARRIARATLTVLVARLPEGERDHLLGHLPPDARALAQPRLTEWGAEDIDTAMDLDVAVASASGQWHYEPTDRAVRAVVHTLRALVPEEAADVAAVLPVGLRELWSEEAAVSSST